MKPQRLAGVPILILLFGMVWPQLASADASGIVSDQFDGGTLNTSVWTFSDPVGDSQLFMTGTEAQISVPAGSSHDLWQGQNRAPRIMQAANNTDFEIEVKFNSNVVGRNEMQGVLVESDAQNFIRFDFYSDGTSIRVFAASFLNGVPTIRRNVAVGTVPSVAPLYLRVQRIGNQWTQWYSFDGSNWLTAVTFSHALVVRRVGYFAGNAINNPEVASAIDYFLNTADRVQPVGSDNNVVANSGFESGVQPWDFVTNGAGALATDVTGPASPAAARVLINTQGTNVQLSQSGLVLEPNTQYALAFKAYSNTGHDVAVSVLKHLAPGTSYGLAGRVFDLTTAWKTFSVNFTTTGFPEPVSDGRLTFALGAYDAAGDRYFFDDVTLTKLPTDVPPSISAHPVNRTVTVGQTATFSVTALGSDPLTYQWQKNGVDIPNATGASYTTPPTLLADSGSIFRVTVRNSYGTATSNDAALTVSSPPAQLLLLDRTFDYTTSYSASLLGETPSPTRSNCISVQGIYKSGTTPANVCNHEAFKFFQMPAANPANWISPVNYSNGTLYQRLQVITKPSATPVMFALCMFQDETISSRHACGSLTKLRFTATGTYTSTQTMTSLFQYATAIDWTRKPNVIMLHITDANKVQPDSYPEYLGRWFGSPNWGLYYPMRVRYTAIVVPSGGGAPVWPQ
jgi:hypothetical protein